MIPRSAVFLVSAATLLLEIVLTRIFSVVFWYHFAFVAISVAMAGIALSGLLLQGARAGLLARPERTFALSCLGFQASSLGVIALALSAGRNGGAPATTALLLVCTAATLPFLAGGLAVGVALAARREATGSTYAADLAGAAAGAIGAPMVLATVDGPAAGLVAGLLAAAAGVVCLRNRPQASAALAGAALLILQVAIHPLAVRCAKGDCERPERERWNHFSRVAVGPAHSGRPVGLSWKWEGAMSLRSMAIDASAATPIIAASTSSGWTSFALTALPYRVRPGVRTVFVSGAGGGPDVLIARAMGAGEVTAAEINPAVVEMTQEAFAGFSGRPLSAPGVELRTDDARSILERDPRRFDLMVMSLVDTFAAASAGAFALTESNLYTREAFSLDFDRLEERGMLAVSRWYYPGHPVEMARLTALARSALEERGRTPAADRLLLAAWQVPDPPPGHPRWGVGLLLASAVPFEPAERDRFREACDRVGFSVLWPAGDPPPEPQLASLLRAPDLKAWAGSQEDVLAPPTDDWPFFFQASRLRRISVGDYLAGGMQVLMVLLSAASGFALALVLLGRRLASPSGGLPASLAAFALGVGFMLVEIGLLQRFLLLLGHPTYSLALVLPAILLAASAGSAAPRTGPVRACLIVASMAVLAAFLLPPAVHALLPLPRLLKGALALPVLIAVGFPLGMPFPALLRREGVSAPWLWAVNGAASVVGSVTAMVIGVLAGYAAVFLAAAATYALAAVALSRRTSATAR